MSAKLGLDKEQKGSMMAATAYRSAVGKEIGASATTFAPLLLVERILSVQALSWVLENSEAELGARHVLISIANHAKRDGTGAWPSVSTMARESRLSERAVQYGLRELVALGEVEITPNAGPHGTNLYALPKMTGAKNAPVQNTTDRGAKYDSEGCNGLHPNRPIKQPSKNQPSLEGFDSFYVSYPRKVGKPQARRAWKAHVFRGDALPDDVMSGLAKWNIVWRTKEIQFIPYPATWLNGEHWRDEPAADETLLFSEATAGQGPSAGMNAKAISRYLQRGAK